MTLKCSECGKDIPPGEEVLEDYCLMNTDEVIATMPVCPVCADDETRE